MSDRVGPTTDQVPWLWLNFWTCLFMSSWLTILMISVCDYWRAIQRLVLAYWRAPGNWINIKYFFFKKKKERERERKSEIKFTHSRSMTNDAGGSSPNDLTTTRRRPSHIANHIFSLILSGSRRESWKMAKLTGFNWPTKCPSKSHFCDNRNRSNAHHPSRSNTLA